MAQVANDPHIRKREMILEVDRAPSGKLKVTGTPMKFSRTPCKIERGCPDLGHDTREILSTWLGLPSKKLDELTLGKVIFP